MSAEKSGPGPKLGYWHLWTDAAGVSHQDQRELANFKLGAVGDAAPQ